MLAPNMNLELGFREPVQTAGNSPRLEQKSSGPSSFERALERARTEKTSASETVEAKTDETVESQSTISKEGEQVVLEESAPNVADKIKTQEKTIASVSGFMVNMQTAALVSVIAVGSSLIYLLIERIMYNKLCKKLLLLRLILRKKVSIFLF